MKNGAKKLGLGSAALAAFMLVAVPSPMRAQQERVQGPLEFSAGGWLGVSVEEVTPDKAKELKLSAAYGVHVSEVGENSPAAKAGVKQGDVIIEYDGERIEGTAEFRRLVRETPPGRTAQLSVRRDGRTQKLSAEIGRVPAPDRDTFFGRAPMPMPRDFEFRRNPRMPGAPGEMFGRRGIAGGPTLGVSAQDLSGQLGEYFGAPEGEGVLVTDVRQGTAGEKAGLKAGDVITKVNGERVRNVGELRSHLREVRDSQSVALTVLRKGTELMLTAQPEMPQPPRLPGPNRGFDGPRIPL